MSCRECDILRAVTGIEGGVIDALCEQMDKAAARIGVNPRGCAMVVGEPRFAGSRGLVTEIAALDSALAGEIGSCGVRDAWVGIRAVSIQASSSERRFLAVYAPGGDLRAPGALVAGFIHGPHK